MTNANLEKRLEKVLPLAEPVVILDNVRETLAEDPRNYKTIEGLPPLLFPRHFSEMNPKDPKYKEMFDMFSKELVSYSPARLAQIIDQRIAENRASLASIVQSNYEHIVLNSDEVELINLAMILSGKEEAYKRVRQNIKDGKLEDVRKEYAATFEDNSWRTFISGASDKFVRTYAPLYFELDQNTFIHNFYEETEIKGKKILTLSRDKLIDYIMNKYSSADVKNRPALASKTGETLFKVYLERMQREKAEEKKAAA